MTRLHYTSRTNSRPGRAYRGLPAGKPKPAAVIVPVTEGLRECPVCHGGVKLVRAPFTDPELAIVYGISHVLGSHRFGGSPAGSTAKCVGSHQLP